MTAVVEPKNTDATQPAGDTIVSSGSGNTLVGETFSPQGAGVKKRGLTPTIIEEVSTYLKTHGWNPLSPEIANHLLGNRYKFKRSLETQRDNLTSRFFWKLSRGIKEEVRQLSSSIDDSVKAILGEIAKTRNTVLRFAGELKKDFGGQQFRIGFESGKPTIKDSRGKSIPVPAPLMAAVVPAPYLGKLQSIETLCSRIQKNSQIESKVEQYGSEPKLTALTITNKLGEKMTLIEVHPGRVRLYRTIDGHELEYAGSFWNALGPDKSGKRKEFKADSIIRAFYSGQLEIKLKNNPPPGQYRLPEVNESVYLKPLS